MRASAEPNERHLDDLALDALRAGDGTPEDAAHVEGCLHCRVALEKLAQLEAALKSAQPHTPDVPRDLEYRIFRAYRDAIATRSARAPLTRRWALPAAGLAAAAAVTLMLSVRPAPPPAPDRAPRGPGRVALAPSAPPPLEAPRRAAEVDIVDAFQLARALRDGGRVAPGWDADGNGAVDAADVQAIARRAVAL